MSQRSSNPEGQTQTATADMAAAARCPLCERENNCAVASGSDPAHCWCMGAALAPQALARAKALRADGQPPTRCICAHCGRS